METVIKDIEILSDSKSEIEKNPTKNPNGRKLYIESYGCAMNFSDSEIVMSIMEKEGFQSTNNLNEADYIFLNTCSIRDKAEQTIRKRLSCFRISL